MADQTRTVTPHSDLPLKYIDMGDGTYALGVYDRASAGGGALKVEDAAHSSGDSGLFVLAVRNDGGSVMAGTTGDYIPFTTDNTGALRVTGGGGGTQYTEDNAHSSGDTGTMALAVRRDANTSLVGTDGDYAPLQVDATGNLKVNIVAGSATGFAEDAAHTTGDVGQMALAVRKDTATALAGTDGDYIPLITDANGRLHVLDANSAAAAASLSVLDDWDESDRAKVNLIAGQAGVAGGSGTAGATTQRVTIATDDVVSIDDGGSTISIDDGGGSITVDGTLTVSSGSLTAEGTVAHDATDSGAPIKFGAKAETALSGITLVADGDRTDVFSGVDGVLFVRPHSGLEDLVDGVASTTTTGSTAVITAGGANVKQYLTSCIISNSSSTTATVNLLSGSTVKATFPVPAQAGVVHTWNTPLKPNAANEAWNFQASAAVSTMTVTLNGFKSKV